MDSIETIAEELANMSQAASDMYDRLFIISKVLQENHPIFRQKIATATAAQAALQLGELALWAQREADSLRRQE
jgi:hypothetical protein